jgi:uncharacterized ferritin-like protein (DUF455 family)
MNWEPFQLVPRGAYADAPRSIASPDGVGDRLRAAAFAELQAREAFLWAASHFTDAPEGLTGAWTGLAHAEQKHLDWLLNRMKELHIRIEDRRVSDDLWHSLVSCQSARDFAIFMANAENRGRIAGERFHATLKDTDPVTAEIFRKIAEEEVQHIELARKFFPEEQGTC